jgi:spermidine synthase
VWSGLVQHGLQFLAPERRRLAAGYHGRGTGVGLAVTQHPRRREGLRIGVVGLGAGALAAYAEAGDALRFYEISPSVLGIAERWFSFLADARARGAELATVLGDARVALEAELASGQPGRFDVLAIDAFTGDAVPVHLLTREAFEVYRRHLRAGGVLAVNVSNLHLDLDPVLRGLAREAGLAALRVTNDADPARGQLPARWWLLSADPRALEQPALARAADPGAAEGRALVWTDDYSSLLGVLR